MFDIIISETIPEEPGASLGGAAHLLVILGVAFLALLVVLWLTIALARYIRKHAAKVRTSLGETISK